MWTTFRRNYERHIKQYEIGVVEAIKPSNLYSHKKRPKSFRSQNSLSRRSAGRHHTFLPYRPAPPRLGYHDLAYSKTFSPKCKSLTISVLCIFNYNGYWFQPSSLNPIFSFIHFYHALICRWNFNYLAVSNCANPRRLL